MLLTEIFSDEEGRLKGVSEVEGIVTLSCPHPRTFVGTKNFLGFPDEPGKSLLITDLIGRAREDTRQYYFIGEPTLTEGETFCIVPYVVFSK